MSINNQAQDTNYGAILGGAFVGALLLPVITGGGIGIAAAGTAIGIGEGIIATFGAVAGATAAHKLSSQQSTDSDDEYEVGF
jgi:hypothetical protein